MRRAREHVDTLCVGRTHGVHAEPTTFGLKLAGFAFEADRNLRRLERAVEGVSVGRPLRRRGHLLGQRAGGRGGGAASGSGLAARDVSTQVVPRDRHAELLSAVALAGAGLERFATEVRHLQRTEVREVEEPFRAGAQKGSSAMPHKRNPIVSERITGIARLLRGYAQAGLENVALWHERDISHSSVERVALPDATTLLDYAQHLAIRVVDGMVVDADADAGEPRAHARRALLPAGAARARGAGRSRDDAYRDRAGGGAARLRRGRAISASCWPSPPRSSTSMRCSTPARSSGTRTSSSGGSTTLSGYGRLTLLLASGA